MKKTLSILALCLLTFIACSDNEAKVYEPVLSKEKIEFPFESLEDGMFSVIYRNYDDQIIPIHLHLVSEVGEVIEDSKELDFCQDVMSIRNGRFIPNWTMINGNFAVIPESAVPNQNDHPNLVSYNLPMGTYIILLDGPETCSRENYVTFDITTNKVIERLQ